MDIIIPSRPRKTTRWEGRFQVEWTINGETFVDHAYNQLYDQGEQDILEMYFMGANAAQAAPANFYVGLLKTAYVITETHTMTNVAAQELTNASDGGYTARQSVARSSVGWPTSALNAGDWQLTSLQVTWTATGAWSDTAGYLFLSTAGAATPGDTTGRIIAVAALSPTRQLQAVNDTLKATYQVKLA